jgi:hypothetical protein
VYTVPTSGPDMGCSKKKAGEGEDTTLFTASQFILSLDSLTFMSHDTMCNIVQTMLYLSDLSCKLAFISPPSPPPQKKNPTPNLCWDSNMGIVHL